MHFLLLAGWRQLSELSILFRARRRCILRFAFVSVFGCIGGFLLLVSRRLLGLHSSRARLRSLIGLLPHLILLAPVSLSASLMLPLLCSLPLLFFFLLLLGLFDPLFQKAKVFFRLFVSRIEIKRLMILIASVVVAR